MKEKRSVEEALGQAEEKYRYIYENAVEGIFQISLDGRFISANPALARIHGFDSPDEMIQRVTNVGEQLCVSGRRRHEYLRLMETEGFARARARA